ncbi:32452_t:CDS:2, partial [Racocetra persica]
VKFIRDDSVYGDKSQTKIAFKIIDKYEPIRESKKAGIDKKFLVREVSEQSEVGKLDTQRVIEHFDNTKRGYGLTEIRRQKINDWEKKMRIPGAPVQDVADGKYRSGKYKEIGIVVHNGHAFPRNQHFPRDRMVEYYKGDTWEAISNTLRGPQAIWLIEVGDTSQTISQFVLEDGRIFRTWKKHTEIIEACKQLVNDIIDWQYQKGIINKEKKSILSESLKVVDLAEQVFGANHAGSQLANEINEWYPIFGKNAPDYHVNDIVCIDTKEYYPASMRGQGECTPWFNRFGHPTHYLVRVAVNGELPEDDITGFAQIRSFKFASNIHSVIPV